MRRLTQINFVNDKAVKPVGSQRFISRWPIFAFSNSDGDKEILEWAAAHTGPHFAAFVRHPNAKRDCAYDRQLPESRLDKAWHQAVARGGTVVDMKNDWKRVLAFKLGRLTTPERERHHKGR